MDLGKKLSMLSSHFDSEAELAGLDVKPPVFESDEDEVVEDFGLGELSINNYIVTPVNEKPKKKSSSGKNKSNRNLFDKFFAGLDEPKEDDLGNLRTGNQALDDATRRSRQLLQEADFIAAEEFDSFLNDDERFENEEKEEMRTSLVAMGRKYARDSAASKESSEISKTFADSERRLLTLFEEVAADKNNIQKDIERMRIPGRGGKILADMISAKNSYHSTQLSIVKELNAMKKTTYELRAKEAARKEAENAGANDLNANTMKSIFSAARSSMLDEVGGYGESVSTEDIHTDRFINEDSDEYIHQKYFKDRPETDGDKWLKYEGRGVHYILIVDGDDNPQRIIAEDAEGQLIPDYPIPDWHDMTFEIDHVANSASDNLHRPYDVRVEE